MDEVIVTTKGDLTRLKAENARMQSELSGYDNKISIPELQSKVNEIRSEVDQLNSRLSTVKSSSVEMITKEEKAKVNFYFIQVLAISIEFCVFKIRYKKSMKSMLKNGES